MEHLNAAQVSSLYEVHMGEYAGEEGVTSMMALMTQHDEGCQPQGDGGGSIMAASSFSSFHGQVDCLLSAAATAMFEAHKLQHLVPAEQTPGVAVSVSSAPLNKTEGCPRFQFRAENCLAEFTSIQLGEPDSPHHITRISTSSEDMEADEMKAKILAHPQYPCLLEAYIDCQKVGAPPEVAARLDAAMKEYECRRHRVTTSIGMDPELDRFMEAYYEMLIKYYEELTKPFNEAMAFFKKIETQLNSLSKAATKICHSAENDEKTEGGGSSDDEYCSTGEMDYQEVDHQSEDRELKDHLLRKYSGYLSSLKQEFMKKKKNGKLPKNARQKLLDWWNLHYKWPYPSETDKAILAESTGLDQKQINNWFINQRKRHWKPPEDMAFMAMDTHGPHGAALYVEGNAFHLDC